MSAVSPNKNSSRTGGRIVAQIVYLDLLPDGAVLDFSAPYNVDRASRLAEWLSERPERGCAYWRNRRGAPLEWAVDGMLYSPTALARKIVFEATGTAIGAIRGTGWWTSKGRSLIEVAQENRTDS